MNILIGNWKMNLEWSSATKLLDDLELKLKEQFNHKPFLSDIDMVVAPPFPYLEYANRKTLFGTGAQNCYFEEKGSFTGEISVTMLKSIGVEYVILGHSERRNILGETDEIISKKIKIALKHGLKAVFCCGESIDIRKKSEHISFIRRQIINSLEDLDESHLRNLIIAYEPIWAIGQDINPAPLEIQEMHNSIRNYFINIYDSKTASNIPIIYGGNLNTLNSKSIFEMPDVDGGLVGRACLDADSFIEILNCFNNKK